MTIPDVFVLAAAGVLTILRGGYLTWLCLRREPQIFENYPKARTGDSLKVIAKERTWTARVCNVLVGLTAGVLADSLLFVCLVCYSLEHVLVIAAERELPKLRFLLWSALDLALPAAAIRIIALLFQQAR